MLRLKRESRTPPGGWFYVVDETQQRINGAGLDHLEQQVVEYLKGNNFPVPGGLRQKIIDFTCARVPEKCLDSGGGSVNPLWLAGRFAGAMVRWAASGFSVVSQDVFHQREATCKACPLWRPEEAFGYGRCGHTGCRCTVIKLFLPSEKCPIDKWGKVT